MGDEPLIPYSGEKQIGEIIDLAGVRLRWGMPSPRSPKPCEHLSLVYSGSDRRIWCEDCERTIDSFDAFYMLTKNFGRMIADVRAKNATAQKAVEVTLVRRAAKQLDSTWSSKMAAACPHCKQGLLAEDFANGVATAYGRDYEIARRRRADVERIAARTHTPRSSDAVTLSASQWSLLRAALTAIAEADGSGPVGRSVMVTAEQQAAAREAVGRMTTWRAAGG